MPYEPTDEEIEWFDRLASKAAMMHVLTWCVKRRKPVFTGTLQGRECLRCEHYLNQDGVCDPL